jgi:hypothetical protein
MRHGLRLSLQNKTKQSKAKTEQNKATKKKARMSILEPKK